MQTIKVMPDYECDPLWIEGIGNIPPSSLPISDELAMKLWSWSDEYDKTLNGENPPDSGFKTEEQEMKFVSLGRELAIYLKQEIGDGFSVEYFNISTNKVENV